MLGRALSPLMLGRALSPLMLGRALSPLMLGRALSPLMLGRALIPLMRDAQKQLQYLEQAMNDSVGSVQMKLLSSRVIDCPQVQCSASPFSGSCPFLNDKMCVLLCVLILSWNG